MTCFADLRPSGHLSDRRARADALELMLAISRYRREANRLRPTWHELLGVLRALGYRKVPVVERAWRPPSNGVPRKVARISSARPMPTTRAPMDSTLASLWARAMRAV